MAEMSPGKAWVIRSHAWSSEAGESSRGMDTTTREPNWACCEGNTSNEESGKSPAMPAPRLAKQMLLGMGVTSSLIIAVFMALPW